MKRILVVDDDDPIRRMVVRILSLSPHPLEVQQASDGPEALRILQAEGPFDLLILDHMMPDMSGLDVLTRLRESEATVDLPVIMLTARSEHQHVLDSLKSGANFFIAKPFEPQQLLDSVGLVLGFSTENQT